MRFDGKVGLVTGASSGLGKMVATALAAEGAAVGALGRDRSALAETVSAIEAQGGRALALTGDLRAATDVEAAVAATVDAYGGLDLVAHAAGVLREGSSTELSEADWDLQFDTNVKSCFLLAKHAVPAMRARGGGAIVNVASVYAYAAVRGSASYAASKAAVVAFTQIAALDHVGDGIRINAVAPGTMRTPMLEAIARERSPDDPEAELAATGRRHPIRRLVEPAEVADLVLYLLSDAASAIVGTCVTIDGGRQAQLGSA